METWPQATEKNSAQMMHIIPYKPNEADMCHCDPSQGRRSALSRVPCDGPLAGHWKVRVRSSCLRPAPCGFTPNPVHRTLSSGPLLPFLPRLHQRHFTKCRHVFPSNFCTLASPRDNDTRLDGSLNFVCFSKSSGNAISSLSDLLLRFLKAEH